MSHPTSRSRATAALALLLLSACAGARVVGGPPDPALVARLTAQADAWDRAIVAKDRAAIEANLADDFRIIAGNGEVAGRRAFVEELLAPGFQMEPYTVEELEVRIHGPVALLSGRTRMRGISEGKPFQTHYRYTDVYVEQGGVWKVASIQITRLRD